eukprot:TRINITY_DN7824_c0_g1_i1.p1 TRINITY_DN7824_c0_g1~~TRINITY_DN7824_c0_g1_i1.p1  ORF type:complete len:546 (-),score=54.05 TRINITY_DN7824_c0_g1_i1:68-1705(-)
MSMAARALRVSAKRIESSLASLLLRNPSAVSFNRSSSPPLDSVCAFSKTSPFVFTETFRKFSTNLCDAVKTSHKSTANENERKAFPRQAKKSISDELCTILDNREILEDDLAQKLEGIDIKMNRTLFKKVLKNVSQDAGRKVLVFYRWATRHPECKPDPELLNKVIAWFCKRNDFKAVEFLLRENVAPENSRIRVRVDNLTFKRIAEALVKAGRGNRAVLFFGAMEEYGFEKNYESYECLLKHLCLNGSMHHAEGLLQEWKHRFYPNENTCSMLVQGWCLSNKLDEARDVLKHMSKAQLKPTTEAYDSLIECVCRLAKEKEPLLLVPEVKKVLSEMDEVGVPRKVSTFNVVISNFCSLRKTEDAYQQFLKMGDYDCSPDYTTYAVLTRSLFLAARTAEGFEMLQKMKDAGFKPDFGTYLRFLRVLCGIQRIEHALKVFDDMKEIGVRPQTIIYELLIPKVRDIGQIEKAKKLFKEAEKKDLLSVESRRDLLYPIPQKPSPKKILNELKRKRLKMVLAIKKQKWKRQMKKKKSFVKKPKKGIKMRA